MDPILNYNMKDDANLEVKISGGCVVYDTLEAKENLIAEITKGYIKKVTFNTKELTCWDSTFVAMIFSVVGYLKDHGIEYDISSIPTGAQRLLKLAFSVNKYKAKVVAKNDSFLSNLGQKTLNMYNSFMSGVQFLWITMISVVTFLLGKATYRKIDFGFALEDCSYKALPIVSLISFMVGLIFGFVGAVQLKVFGAQIFVASLVAIAMTRVMGAVMTGIIMAGRTGSAYAATIGTMQVNEEIDALKTMGIPVIDFLLIPRMMALMIMMPFLTIFSDVVGIFGGAFVGIFMLDLAPSEYWNTTVDAMNMANFLVGVIHGFVFGIIIAICGCYCGIKSGRDADSVGKATTNAVVFSIVWIIIATAIITVICQVLGV